MFVHVAHHIYMPCLVFNLTQKWIQCKPPCRPGLLAVWTIRVFPLVFRNNSSHTHAIKFKISAINKISTPRTWNYYPFYQYESIVLHYGQLGVAFGEDMQPDWLGCNIFEQFLIEHVNQVPKMLVLSFLFIIYAIFYLYWLSRKNFMSRTWFRIWDAHYIYNPT